MLTFPLSLCSLELSYSITMSPYLLLVSQMSHSAQFQLFFLAFPLFCSTHQVTHPCLLKSWSPPVLSKIFFSFMLLSTCGAYAPTMFSIDPFTSNVMAIGLSDTIFTSKTLSTSFSITIILIPFLFPLPPL